MRSEIPSRRTEATAALPATFDHEQGSVQAGRTGLQKTVNQHTRGKMPRKLDGLLSSGTDDDWDSVLVQGPRELQCLIADEPDWIRKRDSSGSRCSRAVAV